MKYIAALLCSIILIGCFSSQIENSGIIKPVLIYQFPLPSIPHSISESQLILNLNLFIMEDGSVSEVNIKNNDLDKDWAAQAKVSIMKWKYSPAMYNNKPIKIWINQKTIVNIVESVFYKLAEIQLDSLTTAQKVYNLLKEKKDFEDLARSYSTAPSGKMGGIIGSVDIMRYPLNIRKEILKLSYYEYTTPLKYDYKYVIFMLLK